MKTILFIGILSLFLCCDKPEPIIVDLCPTCIALVQLNNAIWSSDLRYAWFQIPTGTDTFFTLEFRELNPVHDQFADGILFWRIPYEEGVQRIDSTSIEMKTSAILFVFEGGIDSPNQIYMTVPDSNSYYNVELLDKSTGNFEMSFQIFLHPLGIPGSPADNSTYPGLVEVKGNASGKIVSE